jgi:hypothetical protein
VSKAILDAPITEQQIQRSAAGMIEAFSTGAAGECAIMISRMTEKGDRLGHQTWERILLAVRRLQRPVAPRSDGNAAADMEAPP